MLSSVDYTPVKTSESGPGAASNERSWTILLPIAGLSFLFGVLLTLIVLALYTLAPVYIQKKSDSISPSSYRFTDVLEVRYNTDYTSESGKIVIATDLETLGLSFDRLLGFSNSTVNVMLADLAPSTFMDSLTKRSIIKKRLNSLTNTFWLNVYMRLRYPSNCTATDAVCKANFRWNALKKIVNTFSKNLTIQTAYGRVIPLRITFNRLLENFNITKATNDIALCEAGRFQSPIAVNLPETEFTKYQTFSFSPAYQKPMQLSVKVEKQKTLTLTADIANPAELNVSGGCIGDTYTFYSAHIHWPHSEHVIAGRDFVAEAHFIHQNAKKQEFAVFGFFFTLANSSTTNGSGSDTWDNILGNLNNRTITLNGGLASLMKGNTERFVCYNGSLTTPPCGEGIHWILVSSAIPISQTHIRRLQDGIGTSFFRHPQPVNGRPVRRSFPSTSWID